MATKSKNVYFNFIPSSATLVARAAAYDKANAAANERLEEMRKETFAGLLKAKKATADQEAVFRVGKRWGQWSYWFATVGETAGKGEEL